MKSHISEKSRHVIIRADAGDTLPEALNRALLECEVACGWVRASGVLTDVEIRAFSTESSGLAPARRLAGPVHALAIEGSIGLSRGEVTVGMRALIARETDRGMETVAGELVSARVVALEAVATAFDDLALGRALDPAAGVWLLGDPSSDKRPAPPERAAPKPEPVAWNEAIAASSDPEPVRPPARPAAAATSPSGQGAPMPTRPAARPRDESEDGALMPDAGDAVEHFAFGSAEVLKSDGERLHLRAHKDGRIREIALEMLRVTPLESNGPQRRFKLDRKM